MKKMIAVMAVMSCASASHAITQVQDGLLNDPTTINSDDNHFKYKRCGIVHTKELADAGAIMADRLLTAIPMENRLLCMLHMELGIISTCHANILQFAQVFSIDKAHVALRKKQWNTHCFQ